jgi:hypothetical protein
VLPTFTLSIISLCSLRLLVFCPIGTEAQGSAQSAWQSNSNEYACPGIKANITTQFWTPVNVPSNIPIAHPRTSESRSLVSTASMGLTEAGGFRLRRCRHAPADRRANRFGVHLSLSPAANEVAGSSHARQRLPGGELLSLQPNTDAFFFDGLRHRRRLAIQRAPTDRERGPTPFARSSTSFLLFVPVRDRAPGFRRTSINDSKMCAASVLPSSLRSEPPREPHVRHVMELPR